MMQLPLSDITEGNLSDDMQLPLELKRLDTTFFTYAVIFMKTYKQTHFNVYNWWSYSLKYVKIRTI